MIAWLKGQLIEKNLESVVIDVAGVGYEAYTSMTSHFELPQTGSQVELWIQMIVREDAQLLYGFTTQQERSLFRLLLKVNGVGPKLALGILSGVNPLMLVELIKQQQVKQLVKLPGVGKKTAERLVIELADKLESYETAGATQMNEPHSSSLSLSPQSLAEEEAASALAHLGYKPKQIEAMLKGVKEPGLSTEALIKTALSQSATV